MSDDALAGWAIRRNGSCLLTREVDCGGTVNPFHACCPSSTECPSQYNVACCSSGQNCTASLVETPKCANSSWVMYDNAGYFCCEEGQVGYNRSNTDGCSLSGASIPNGAAPLAQVSQVTTSSTSSTTSTTPTASSSSSPSAQSDSNSATPAGPIAGGVVGGVAFLAIVLGLSYYFYRKCKWRGTVAAGYELPVATPNEKDITTPMPVRSEIDGTSRAELSQDASTGRRVHELY